MKPAASLPGACSVKVLAGLVQDAAGNARETTTTTTVPFVPTGYTLDTTENTLTLSFSNPVTRILSGVRDFSPAQK